MSGDLAVPIVVAVIAAGAAIATPVVTIWIQRRVHLDNRADHFSVRSVLLELVGDVHDLRDDVRELREHQKATATEVAQIQSTITEELIEHEP